MVHHIIQIYKPYWCGWKRPKTTMVAGAKRGACHLNREARRGNRKIFVRAKIGGKVVGISYKHTHAHILGQYIQYEQKSIHIRWTSSGQKPQSSTSFHPALFLPKAERWRVADRQPQTDRHNHTLGRPPILKLSWGGIGGQRADKGVLTVKE